MKNSLVIQTLKKISLSFLLLSLFSCGNNSKAQNGYVVQPNYDHPKFKELDAAFAKQKHRFEIDRCEFKYNGKSFFIGDTEGEIIAALGEPDDIYKDPSDLEYNLKYKKLKLKLWFTKENNKVISLSMQMSSFRGHDDTPYEILKFRKVPYHLDMTLNEFTELCDLEHIKTLGHNAFTFYVKNEKRCDNSKPIETDIGSTVKFHSNDLGGHMTTRGSFASESTDPIRSLYVGLIKTKK